MKSELTIQVVGWNSAGHLRSTFAALKRAQAGGATVRYIDNASKDNSVRLVKQILPEADIVKNEENIGFGPGHNIGFRLCKTPYVLALNPDVIINWQQFKKLLLFFDDNRVAAIQGKLLRAQAGREVKIIDSVGIKLSLALNGIERGAGEVDVGQYEEQEDILAVTGAVGLYRLSSINEVAHRNGEVYDEDFFAYKEDVDLGWRLKNAGYKSIFVPIEIGIHKRVLGRRGLFNWGVTPKKVWGRLRSERTRYSLRNWLWMIFKNASFSQAFKHEIFIDLRIFTFLILSFLYWPLFSIWSEVWDGFSIMARKRREFDIALKKV